MTDIELEAVIAELRDQLVELKVTVKFLQSELEKAFKKLGFPHSFGAEPELQPIQAYNFWETSKTVPQGIKSWLAAGKIKIKIDGDTNA